MKRSGFTMIELIFVIVILGILAAVAIPRLAATRDDAKISTIATNVKQVATDLASAYTASGDINLTNPTQWEAATNVRDNVTFSGSATTPTATFDNGANPAVNCTIVTYDVANGVLETRALNVTDTICAGVNARIGFDEVDDNTTTSIKGSSVTF